MDQINSRQLRRRILVISVFLLAFFGVITWKLVEIQIIEHGHWRVLADRIQERKVTRELKRGEIYDRNGIPLAMNTKAVSIALDNYRMTKPAIIKSILKKKLGIKEGDLDKKIYRKSYFTWIARKVDRDLAKEIKEMTDQKGAQGLIFRNVWKRVYPQEKLASNVIGFSGLDNKGLEGVELAMEQTLRGEQDVLLLITDVYGNPVQEKLLEQGAPGKDIYLTLDAKLQHIAESMIDWGVKKYQAKQGFIIVMDPQNGEILAMAQNLRYNLNAFSTSEAKQRNNLAVTYPFEPGSSFKIFAGLAALKYNAVSQKDWFNGNQPLRIAGHSVHNANYKSYGAVRLEDIIKHSINTGMIRVAQKLGAQNLYRFLQDAGFGQKTHVELPGEVRGTLRQVSEWSKLAIGAIPIGQSVAVTGIQLISAVAAIANGGKLLKPTIVKQIKGEDESTQAENPQKGKRIASREKVKIMKKMMRKVVTEGTGKPADIKGFEVCAKTGTAQKSRPGEGYIKGKYISLFVGFTPQDNPRYVALVLLDEVGTKPFWGGYTSGVIFKKMMEKIIQIKKLKPVSDK